MVVAAARQAEDDAGLDIAADRTGSSRRWRPGSAVSIRSRTATRSSASAVLIGSTRSRSGDHPEPRRRVGLDRARHSRARCRRSARRAQRRTWRSATGWTRSGLGGADVMLCGGTDAPDDRGRNRRLRRNARAVSTERRPVALQPAVRHGARRVRDGRGPARCSCSRSSSGRRGAGRRSTRSSSATGLLGCAAHHRARSDGRAPRARDADGAGRRRDRRFRGRLRQRTHTARRRRSATRARRAS